MSSLEVRKVEGPQGQASGSASAAGQLLQVDGLSDAFRYLAALHLRFFTIIGRTHKSFFGTPAACFERYKLHCEKQKASKKCVVRSSRIFHRERKAQGLGVEMGYANARIAF